MKSTSFIKNMKSTFGTLSSKVNLIEYPFVHLMCVAENHFCHVLVANVKKHLKDNGYRISNAEEESSFDFSSLTPKIVVFDSLPSNDRMKPFSSMCMQKLVNAWISFMIQEHVTSEGEASHVVATKLPCEVTTVQKQTDGTSCGFFAFKSLTECLVAQMK